MIAIYFLYGFRKESFVKLCLRIQSPTVTSTTTTSSFHVTILNLPFQFRKLWVIYLLVQRRQRQSISRFITAEIYSSYIGENLATIQKVAKRLNTHIKYVLLKAAVKIQWYHFLPPLICIWLRSLRHGFALPILCIDV